MSIRPAIIGNWKMNGSGKDVKLVRRFANFLDKQKIAADVMICPPSTLIDRVGDAIKGVKLKKVFWSEKLIQPFLSLSKLMIKIRGQFTKMYKNL